jgi:hypothetical protein
MANVKKCGRKGSWKISQSLSGMSEENYEDLKIAGIWVENRARDPLNAKHST